MEFHEKLLELRKQKGLTQEELAASLYVSRTAISKWESGRGYPNIESLKAIAKFFSITVDELLSSGEMLTIAEEERRQKETHMRDLVYGFLDLSIVMLLFLPFFAMRTGGTIQNVSLISLDGVQLYLKILYFAAVIAMTTVGILFLALQNCQAKVWVKSKTIISLTLGVIMVLLFIVSLQPYATLFAFALLLCKAFLLIHRR
jgi:transcriptional regulator with XRE-family HTH domain